MRHEIEKGLRADHEKVKLQQGFDLQERPTNTPVYLVFGLNKLNVSKLKSTLAKSFSLSYI